MGLLDRLFGALEEIEAKTGQVWFLAFMFTSALWLARLLYVSSTPFLRSTVLENRRAWEWLHKEFVIRETR